MDSGLSAYCHGNAECMGVNPHHPYIQRVHRPFAIWPGELHCLPNCLHGLFLITSPSSCQLIDGGAEWYLVRSSVTPSLFDVTLQKSGSEISVWTSAGGV